MEFHWVISEARHESNEGTSIVQRLICAETGMTYIISINDGVPLSLTIGDKEEIVNSDVARILWEQLAGVVDGKIYAAMMNALGGK